MLLIMLHYDSYITNILKNKSCLVESQIGVVFELFLFSEEFQPHFLYKTFLIQKECIYQQKNSTLKVLIKLDMVV